MPGTPTFIIVASAAGAQQLQAWLNTISGAPVLTEAVTVTDSSGAEKIGQQAMANSIPVVVASDDQVLVSNRAILDQLVKLNFQMKALLHLQLAYSIQAGADINPQVLEALLQ